MGAVDSMLILLPRPTTLIGADTFTTQPLDVSQFGSVQMQLWRGPIAGGGSPTILFYFEESLDAESWALGPATPVGYDPADADTGGDPTLAKPQLFSYAFQLRWFRVRIVLTGTAPVVSCWCEGFLRDGGGGGAWNSASRAPSMAESLMPPSFVAELGSFVGSAMDAAGPDVREYSQQALPINLRMPSPERAGTPSLQPPPPSL
jgi:hypothetical protein